MNPKTSILLVNGGYPDHKLACFRKRNDARDSRLAIGNLQLKGTSAVPILTTLVRGQEQ
jgi:hypothetical protein